MATKERWSCPHCMSRASRACCVACNREMCEDCISLDGRGSVCGLCYDREAAVRKWERLGGKEGTGLDADEWYDKNG
jgi:hypothetical protein